MSKPAEDMSPAPILLAATAKFDAEPPPPYLSSRISAASSAPGGAEAQSCISINKWPRASTDGIYTSAFPLI